MAVRITTGLLLVLAVLIGMIHRPAPLAAQKAADSDEKDEEYTWKKETRKRTVKSIILGGEKVEFVKVPAGNFMMGSDKEKDKDAQEDEQPRHKVTFTKPLWVAKYPVTKGQFAAFVKAKPYESEAESDGKGGYGYDGKEFKKDKEFTWKNTGWDQTDRHPVVNVTFNDAEAYCAWASKQSKRTVRLLNEAEYEYANRGGESTIYITGDDAESLKGFANVGDQSLKAKKIELRDKYPYFEFDDGESFTSPAGKYKPNGFGLYDMTGNVYSWCGDFYDVKLYTPRKDGVTDPKANLDGVQRYRILRGGSWSGYPVFCRASYRTYLGPGVRFIGIGFRVVLD